MKRGSQHGGARLGLSFTHRGQHTCYHSLFAISAQSRTLLLAILKLQLSLGLSHRVISLLRTLKPFAGFKWTKKKG